MSTEKKTWIITGAGRGIGVEIAKAALAAGDNVVATGRSPDAVIAALGQPDTLLVVKLDVTSIDDAETAVQAPSSASAESTCSSTTPPVSPPASSRSSRPSRWTARSPRPSSVR